MWVVIHSALKYSLYTFIFVIICVYLQYSVAISCIFMPNQIYKYGVAEKAVKYNIISISKSNFSTHIFIPVYSNNDTASSPISATGNANNSSTGPYEVRGGGNTRIWPENFRKKKYEKKNSLYHSRRNPSDRNRNHDPGSSTLAPYPTYNWSQINDS